MIESILQSQGAFAGSEANSSKALDKDAFLRLLVTQLQHQDPLNPMDDKQFIAQLAQFSSLEQMNNIAAGITKLTEQAASQDMLSAAAFMGKEVVAAGSGLSKEDGAVSSVDFTLQGTATEVRVFVYDSTNNLVRTEKLSGRAAGTYSYAWDGKDDQGGSLPDGRYTATFAATDAEGTPVLVSTAVSGRVTAVERTDDGVTRLRLADGRTVALGDVRTVTETSTAATAQE
ncbi:MAG: flagellar hook capping protein [Desulfomicrobiaceae bacterium]|jgi:flagellar basal-body rod modification protein FlgD|nr:flagellar hook capping protein [Desulfomicrobiaceae bacterium]